MEFDWSSAIKERQGFFLKSGNGSDLKIVVGTGSDKREFKVHRTLWSQTLQEKMKEAESDELIFQEIDASSMETFLKFVYIGEYPSGVQDSFAASFELFKTAIYFRFIELAQLCTEHLRPHLTTENVLRLFKPAMADGHKPLITHAMDFINLNGDAILQSEQFQNLSLDCVYEIVQQDDLQTESELKVFNAVYKWGEAEARRQKLDSKDPLQLRTLLDKPLKWVRFPLMSTDEYRNGVAPKGLLHSKEIDCLLTFFMTPTEQRSTLPEELFISRARNSNKRPHLKVSIAGDQVIKKLFFDVDPEICNAIKLKSMLKEKFNYPICHQVNFLSKTLNSLESQSYNLGYFGVKDGTEITLNKMESKDDKKFCPQCSHKPETFCFF